MTAPNADLAALASDTSALACLGADADLMRRLWPVVDGRLCWTQVVQAELQNIARRTDRLAQGARRALKMMAAKGPITTASIGQAAVDAVRAVLLQDEQEEANRKQRQVKPDPRGTNHLGEATSLAHALQAGDHGLLANDRGAQRVAKRKVRVRTFSIVDLARLLHREYGESEQLLYDRLRNIQDDDIFIGERIDSPLDLVRSPRTL